jgi:hypothetical protein
MKENPFIARACFTLCLLFALTISSVSCASEADEPASIPATSAPPAATAAPDLTGDLSHIVVDLEECVQNLGANTGKDHKAKGIVLQLSEDQYIDFVRQDMYAYRSGSYASASDPVCLKCSIRILDYLNQMSQDKKQWLAGLFMKAYKSGYEGK